MTTCDGGSPLWGRTKFPFWHHKRFRRATSHYPPSSLDSTTPKLGSEPPAGQRSGVPTPVPRTHSAQKGQPPSPKALVSPPAPPCPCWGSPPPSAPALLAPTGGWATRGGSLAAPRGEVSRSHPGGGRPGGGGTAEKSYLSLPSNLFL